jgi:hypothetical protein
MSSIASIAVLPPDLLAIIFEFADLRSICLLWSTGNKIMKEKIEITPTEINFDLSTTKNPVWPSIFLSRLHFLHSLSIPNSHLGRRIVNVEIDFSIITTHLKRLNLSPPKCNLIWRAPIAKLFPNLTSLTLETVQDIEDTVYIPFPPLLTQLTLNILTFPIKSVLKALPPQLQSLHIETDSVIPCKSVNWPKNLTALSLDVIVIDHSFLHNLPPLLNLKLLTWYSEHTAANEEWSAEGVRESESQIFLDFWDYLPDSLTKLEIDAQTYSSFHKVVLEPLDLPGLPQELRKLTIRNASFSNDLQLTDLWPHLPHIEVMHCDTINNFVTSTNIRLVPQTYKKLSLSSDLTTDEINSLPKGIMSIYDIEIDQLSDPRLILPPALTKLVTNGNVGFRRLNISLPPSITTLILSKSAALPKLSSSWTLPSKLVKFSCPASFFNAPKPHKDSLRILPPTLDVLEFDRSTDDITKPHIFECFESAQFLPPCLRTLSIICESHMLSDHYDIYQWIQYIPTKIPLATLKVRLLSLLTFTSICPISSTLPPSLRDLTLSGKFDPSHFAALPRGITSLRLIAQNCSEWTPSDLAQLPPATRCLIHSSNARNVAIP